MLEFEVVEDEEAEDVAEEDDDEEDPLELELDVIEPQRLSIHLHKLFVQVGLS